MDFIEQTNKVLFFVFLVGMLIVMLASAYDEMSRMFYEPPAVKVIEKADGEEPEQQISYDKEYLTKINEVYIFELKSDVVHTYQDNAIGRFNSYSEDVLSTKTINMIFTKEGEKGKLLFETNRLIFSFKKLRGRSTEHYGLSKNIYSVVEKDTNDDSVLDKKDKLNLYVSRHDGSNLTLVMEDYDSFRVIEDDLLMLSKYIDGKQTFYTYEIKSGQIKPLDVG